MKRQKEGIEAEKLFKLINNRSIIIDRRSRVHRLHFFQLYTCHLPYVLSRTHTHSSISFINSRFGRKDVKEKSCHSFVFWCITSIETICNEAQKRKEETATSIYPSEWIYNLFKVLIGLLCLFTFAFVFRL